MNNKIGKNKSRVSVKNSLSDLYKFVRDNKK